MSDETSVGWGFLRSRRWLGYFVLLIVFSIVCVLLGNWQFDRRAEARAEIARIDTNYDATPVPLAQAVPQRTEFNEDVLKWQPVTLNGHYIGQPYLARNRPGPQGVGSNLIQAFQNTDGTVLFIDRGWVPVSGVDGVPAELPTAAQEELVVEARLRAGEPQIAGRTTAGQSVASINLNELATLLGVEDQAYLGAYGQLISESPAGETGVLAERPERDEGPHLSYALQWYVFILIALSGLVYGARQEFRNLNAGSKAVEREIRRREARKERRRPSDAEEEDALLDQ